MPKRHCPYIESPFPECYCLRSESIWAERVLELCAGRFELCEYYANSFDGEDEQEVESGRIEER